MENSSQTYPYQFYLAKFRSYHDKFWIWYSFVGLPVLMFMMIYKFYRPIKWNRYKE